MKLLKEGEELDEVKRREGNEIKRMDESNDEVYGLGREENG